MKLKPIEKEALEIWLEERELFLKTRDVNQYRINVIKKILKLKNKEGVKDVK